MTTTQGASLQANRINMVDSRISAVTVAAAINRPMNTITPVPIYAPALMQVLVASAWYLSGAIFHRSATFNTILSDISLNLCLFSNMNCISSSCVSAGILYFSNIPCPHICLILNIRSLMLSMVRSR